VGLDGILFHAARPEFALSLLHLFFVFLLILFSVFEPLFQPVVLPLCLASDPVRVLEDELADSFEIVVIKLDDVRLSALRVFTVHKLIVIVVEPERIMAVGRAKLIHLLKQARLGNLDRLAQDLL
jgi:hypothetical protein